MDVCIDAFLKQESRDCAPPFVKKHHIQKIYMNIETCQIRGLSAKKS